MYQNGIYVDGHDHADVVEDRMSYIAIFDELSKLAPSFVGENMDIVEPILPPDTKKVYIYHT